MSELTPGATPVGTRRRPAEVRAMRAADIPAVCAIDRLCFPTPWSGSVFAAELASAIAHYRVAEVEGRVVGYAGSHVVQDEAHITLIGVDPAFRRRGIGERLLAETIRHAVDQGCIRMTLEVRASSLPAQELYRKYGFSPVSLRRRYYSDNDEDAIVMWIEDMTSPAFRALLAERLSAL